MDPMIAALQVTLTLFVLVIAWTDLRSRRIPNAIVFPAALAGLVLNTISGGWSGALFGLKGIGLGLLLLLIPYMVGGLKAGDVKFLMAIGAYLGAGGVFRALLATVLCYPVLAAFAVIREGKLRLTWLRFRRVWWNFLGFFAPGFRIYAIRLESQDDPGIDSVRTPFGVSIAIGTLIAAFTDFLR